MIEFVENMWVSLLNVIIRCFTFFKLIFIEVKNLVIFFKILVKFLDWFIYENMLDDMLIILEFCKILGLILIILKVNLRNGINKLFLFLNIK